MYSKHCSIHFWWENSMIYISHISIKLLLKKIKPTSKGGVKNRSCTWETGRWDSRATAAPARTHQPHSTLPTVQPRLVVPLLGAEHRPTKRRKLHREICHQLIRHTALPSSQSTSQAALQGKACFVCQRPVFQTMWEPREQPSSNEGWGRSSFRRPCSILEGPISYIRSILFRRRMRLGRPVPSGAMPGPTTEISPFLTAPQDNPFTACSSNIHMGQVTLNRVTHIL